MIEGEEVSVLLTELERGEYDFYAVLTDKGGQAVQAETIRVRMEE